MADAGGTQLYVSACITSLIVAIRSASSTISVISSVNASTVSACRTLTAAMQVSSVVIRS